MIDQSRRPLPTPLSAANLERLSERAAHQGQQHQHPLHARWRTVRTTLAAPSGMFSRVPSRYALHAIVTLTLPAAIVFSQLHPSAPQPAPTPSVPQHQELMVPVAPLSLDGTATIGDAPLGDDIPMPLPLVSRSEALAPSVVLSSIGGDRVVLRGGPSTGYDASGKMDANTPVQVIGRYGDWFQIREGIDKPVYWVSGELIAINSNDVNLLSEVAKDALPALPPAKIGVVREEGLQLRDGPGTNYVSFAKLKNGTQVDLLEIYQDWYHIGLVGGGNGWVKGDFLNIADGVLKRVDVAATVPEANPAMVGTITESNVNLRQGPDSKYDKVGNIASQAQVSIIGKYNDWFKVKTGNGTTAWLFNDFLNMSKNVALRVPTTSDFPGLRAAVTAVAAPRANTTKTTAAAAAQSSAISIPASGDVASFAARFAGSRYVWGGASPGGFDCSGLTMYVYRQFGISLPHSAAAQFSGRYGAIISSIRNLAPGDLVFFAGTAGERGISHTGIYLGGGRIVHAMTPSYGVQVSNINDSYWVSHFYGGVRVAR